MGAISIKYYILQPDKSIINQVYIININEFCEVDVILKLWLTRFYHCHSNNDNI